MKKMLALIQRDLWSTLRDAMLLYVLVAPFLICVGARLLLPTVGQTSGNLILTEQDAAQLAEPLSAYGNVQIVRDRAALERRVRAFDDATGLVSQGDGSYDLVLEGNETHDAALLPRLALQHALGESTWQPELVAVSGDSIPYREWVGAFLALSSLFFGGIVLSFYIIEDKETGMAQALGVSPLTHSTYVAARVALVVMLSVVTIYTSLAVLGLTHYSPWQLLAAILVGCVPALLFGLTIGALSGNQITGIANLKFGFLLVLLPAALHLMLPARWQPALYWLPTYWAFRGFRAILVDGAAWAVAWPLFLATLTVSIVYLAAAWRWLARRLTFGQ
jgi:ABC-2 type transport system permease protein